jgi:hypothetical protein
VTLIDLADKVCPGGPPCAELVDGFRPRPDGSHYSPRTAVWSAHWVLDHIAVQAPR